MTIAVDPSLADQGLCHRPSGRWWIAQHPPSRPFAQHFGRVLYPVVTGPQRVSGFAAEDGDGGVQHPRRGSQTLFGFGQARSPIAREATALVVSGYPTVVAYHRVGLANTVAPCGPHPTADQVATLSRYCDRAVILTPDDGATRHLLDSDAGGYDLDLYVAQTPTVEGADITRETAVAAARSAMPLPVRNHPQPAMAHHPNSSHQPTTPHQPRTRPHHHRLGHQPRLEPQNRGNSTPPPPSTDPKHPPQKPQPAPPHPTPPPNTPTRRTR